MNPKNKKNTSLKSSQSLQYCIEVLQNGVVQACLDGRPPLWGSRRITLGSASTADLSLPYALLPAFQHLFTLTNRGLQVHIYPSMRGIICKNRLDSPRDIDHFLMPEGGLGVLAEEDDPLCLTIEAGGWGMIEFHNHSLLFRVDTKKEFYNKMVPKQLLQGARRNPFAMPIATDPVEKWSILVAFFCCALLGSSVIFWLTQTLLSNDIEEDYWQSNNAYSWIHPDHYRHVPMILGEQYSFEKSSLQVKDWLITAQRRWLPAQLLPYREALPENQSEADYPILSHQKDPEPDLSTRYFNAVQIAASAVSEGWQKANPYALERQFKGPPRFAVLFAGGVGLSIHEQLLHNIEFINKVYEVLDDKMRTENSFLSQYFKPMGISIDGLLADPKFDQASLVFAEPLYKVQRTAILHGQSLAQVASLRQEPRALLQRNAGENSNRQGDDVNPSLGIQSLFVPHFFEDKLSASLSNALSYLQSNTDFATGRRAVPVAPPPAPVIDALELKMILALRKQEITSCYLNYIDLERRKKGEIVLAWSIDLSGKPQGIQIQKSTYQDKGFIGCARSKISRWKFPKPKNGSYPVTYSVRL